MRYAWKAVDFGAGIVFIAMCAKAFWRHFYNDLEQPPRQQKLPLFNNSRRGHSSKRSNLPQHN